MSGGEFYDDEDEIKEELAKEGGGGPREFECPSCNANNPVEAPIKDMDEVLCNYCGTEFRAKVSDTGKLKLREL